jgi:hypothetical protein
MTHERKSITPHEFKLDEAGAVTVAFSQLNVMDHDRDVTRPGAFSAKAVPMSAFNHTSWDGAMPVGKGTIGEAGGWGVFSGQFLMDTDQGRNAHATVKAMADLQEWSYGFLPVKFSFGQHEGQDVRFLDSLDVFEVSPVLRGAGLGTHTMSIKSAPGSDAPYAEHFAWLLGEMKAFASRTRDRSEWRAKEGRTLSEASVDQLQELFDGSGEMRDDLLELIAMNEPAKSVARRRLAIEIELGIARMLGINT